VTSWESLQKHPVLKNIRIVFTRSKPAILGLAIVLGIVFVALAAPILAPYDPIKIDLAGQFTPPGSSHLLGTDEVGRDILSRIIYGTRVSLRVGLIAVGIGGVVGVLAGAVSGYYGGYVDDLIQRLVDIIIVFPTLLLALAIIAILGPGMTNAMIAVGLTMAPRFARIVRGSVLSIKEFEYVEAARALGQSNWSIIGKHVLPNVISPVIVYGTLSISTAILVEASLSFLGLGVAPPTPSWGTMVATGRQFLLDAPWMSTFPGVAVMITILGFNLLGDGFRDALDPHTGQSGTGI